ncbi:MAG: rRNA pseudouridine synthase [Ruminococcaceae bacterium]|nr:rRNA pseudouridine synthase [Oscillospiraceae bacterium]
MNTLERLDKIISTQTSYSRKEIKKLARMGDIQVNGGVCKNSDTKINPNTDIVTVCGEKISYQKYVYYMLNKPKGVLSASNDKNAVTVVDILPQELKRKNLFPAGRLDKDTTGLLIITDDGDFAHRMLSPSKKVYKHYIATLDKELDDTVKEKFENGIVLSDGTVCQKAFFEKLEPKKALVKICEGKFHQVKKMFLSCSYMVVDLERVQIGELKLDSNLHYGQARILSEKEKQAVFSVKNDQI